MGRGRVVVTGAFSYTGSSVARELLASGHAVHTLTNRRAPEDAKGISTTPLRFEVDHLARELAGADALVNTYWIRIPHDGQTFETAVERTQLLFEAARQAEVKRVVHVSVSNAHAGTNLGYYAGKARIEDWLRASGLSYAIVRPTLVVGPNDVLSNNIAWLLRRFPLFLMPGDGRCRLQPVTLSDTGRIIAGAVDRTETEELDAAGPDVFTFADYVRLLARACGVKRGIWRVPSGLALFAVRIAGLFMRDVILTREELLGLQQELLLSHEPPRGQESVAAWLMAHGGEIGRSYVNDLARHFRAAAELPVLLP